MSWKYKRKENVIPSPGNCSRYRIHTGLTIYCSIFKISKLNTINGNNADSLFKTLNLDHEPQPWSTINYPLWIGCDVALSWMNQESATSWTRSYYHHLKYLFTIWDKVLSYHFQWWNREAALALSRSCGVSLTGSGSLTVSQSIVRIIIMNPRVCPDKASIMALSPCANLIGNLQFSQNMSLWHWPVINPTTVLGSVARYLWHVTVQLPQPYLRTNAGNASKMNSSSFLILRSVVTGYDPTRMMSALHCLPV